MAMINALSTPEDFLSNDSFIHYCIGDDEEIVTIWDNWIENNPDKAEAVEEAKRIFSIICGHEGNIEAETRKFSLLLDQHIKKEAGYTERKKWNNQATGVFSFFKYWQAVAAILVLVSGIMFWYSYSNKSLTTPQLTGNIKKKITDALPGGPKARLIMGDGTIIDLDSLQSGNLKEKDGTDIEKRQDELVYSNEKSTGNEVLYNRLTTPRGGEYKLVLPDGSKVWLNSASSIRFPLKFTNQSRMVQLTGEAYFDIIKDAGKPFQVQISNGLQIEVLGTQFNVMDYDDETAVKTTLVEGKVKMGREGNMLFLMPSQQGIFRKAPRSLKVQNADVEKEIAWKTGHFEFDEDDLPAILRQLARWYDVDVSFSGVLPDKHYSGTVSKQLTLIQVLEVLRLAGIQYSLENKNLLIKKI